MTRPTYFNVTPDEACEDVKRRYKLLHSGHSAGIAWFLFEEKDRKTDTLTHYLASLSRENEPGLDLPQFGRKVADCLTDWARRNRRNGPRFQKRTIPLSVTLSGIQYHVWREVLFD